MNAADWISATGNPIIGRGPFRRPPNPKLLAAALGKTAPSSRSRSSGGTRYRRLILEIARLTAPVDLTPSRVRRTRTTALDDYSYWNAGPLERAASDAVKQRFRVPHLR